MEYIEYSEQLMQFGLTRQEAGIYLCLHQNGDLTGYEVAKQTGISRSNVYNALAGLVEKGAAYLMEGSTSKYTAVTIREFCENKINGLKELSEYLEKNIPDARTPTDGYITIEGYKHILDKVMQMIKSAEYRIYLSASSDFIRKIETVLCETVKAGKKLVLITDCNLFRQDGVVTYITKTKEKQLRLIIDSTYVLTGEVSGSDKDTCLYCGQENFVNVFKEALHNEIKLIELTGGEKDV